jgi:hypothetical protein
MIFSNISRELVEKKLLALRWNFSLSLARQFKPSNQSPIIRSAWCNEQQPSQKQDAAMVMVKLKLLRFFPAGWSGCLYPLAFKLGSSVKSSQSCKQANAERSECIRVHLAQRNCYRAPASEISRSLFDCLLCTITQQGKEEQ